VCKRPFDIARYTTLPKIRRGLAIACIRTCALTSFSPPVVIRHRLCREELNILCGRTWGIFHDRQIKVNTPFTLLTHCSTWLDMRPSSGITGAGARVQSLHGVTASFPSVSTQVRTIFPPPPRPPLSPPSLPLSHCPPPPPQPPSSPPRELITKASYYNLFPQNLSCLCAATPDVLEPREYRLHQSVLPRQRCESSTSPAASGGERQLCSQHMKESQTEAEGPKKCVWGEVGGERV